MKKKILFLVIFLTGGFVWANTAPVNKSCVAINEIENKAFADDVFFRTIMDRLQNAIVNTGKYDVVDRKRLGEIASELEIEENQLTDEVLDLNVRLAAISIHGAVLSMTKTSKKINLYNQQYKRVDVILE